MGGGKETECGEVAVPSEEGHVPDHIRIAKFPRTRWRRALRCRAMDAFYIFQFDSASSPVTPPSVYISGVDANGQSSRIPIESLDS